MFLIGTFSQAQTGVTAHLLHNNGFSDVRNYGEKRKLYILCLHNSHKAVRLKTSYLSNSDSSRKSCVESERIFTWGIGMAT